MVKVPVSNSAEFSHKSAPWRILEDLGGSVQCNAGVDPESRKRRHMPRPHLPPPGYYANGVTLYEWYGMTDVRD